MSGTKMRLGLSVGFAILVAGCDPNHNLYEPKSFQKQCNQAISANAAVPNWSGRYLQFKDDSTGVDVASDAIRALPYKCDAICADALVHDVHIVMDNRQGEFAKYYESRPKPAYLRALRKGGIYEYVFLTNGACADTAAHFKSPHANSAIIPGWASCIGVKPLDKLPPVIVASVFDSNGDGNESNLWAKGVTRAFFPMWNNMRHLGNMFISPQLNWKKPVQARRPLAMPRCFREKSKFCCRWNCIAVSHC